MNQLFTNFEFDDYILHPRALFYRDCVGLNKPSRSLQATIARATTWATGDVLTAAALNGEFNVVFNDYNGNITDANVASGAAIALAKITGTAVNLTATQTLSNKTLTKPTIDGSVQGTSTLTPSAGGTQDLSGASDNVFLITMPAGNITLTVSNMTVGQFFLVRILQDSVGSRTVTWFGTITWTGATAPTLTTTASRADLFAFFVRASGTYDGFIVGQNIG